MAIFDEKHDTTKKQFIALLDKETGDQVAIVNPSSKVTLEALMEGLTAKGLTVELRESKPEVTSVAL